MKIKLETKQIDQFYFKLNNFAEANVEATKKTLNICAGISRRNAVKNIQSNFILRNNYTVKAVRYTPAEGTSINSLESKVGAIEKAKYLEYQDKGGIRPKRGKNYAMPTKDARGGSNRRVVNKEFYMSKIISGGIKRGKPKVARGRRGNGVAQMYIAHKFGKYIVRDKRIYRVDSFEKKSRSHVVADTTLLYDLRRSPVKIKPTYWLQRAIEKPARDIDNIYFSQMKKLWRANK